MEHNANIPVVVVTEEKKRRKGALLIAGITAGAIALVGGGTFALWSASGTFDGGEIVAGELAGGGHEDVHLPPLKIRVAPAAARFAVGLASAKLLHGACRNHHP